MAETVAWNLDDSAWSAALARCPGATFYHSAGWLRCVEKAFGATTHRVSLPLTQGRYALAAVSVRPLARGWVPLAVLGETGGYGGLLSPEPLTEAETELAYGMLRKRFPNLQVVGNPFAPGPHLPGMAVGSEQSTHVLELAPFDQLRQGFSRGAKSRGNKARRHGYELMVARDVEAFYPLYQQSARRWGEKLTWERPKAFFQHLLEQGGPSVACMLATYQGEPVSGLVIATHGAYAHYIAGATRTDHLDHSPSNYLIEEALSWHAAAGRAAFDFGPSQNLEGVVRFKEGFGAKPLAFGAVTNHTLAGKAYFALRTPWLRLRGA